MKKNILSLLSLLIISGCSSINSSISSVNSSRIINSESFSSESSLIQQSSEVIDEFVPYSEIMKVPPVVDNEKYTDDNFKHGVIQGNVTSRKENQLRFFSINDTHGALDSNDDMVGMDKVYNLQKSLENENGKYINLLLGDIFQGGWLSNKTYGKAFVEVINKMNFSAFVLGNHEFDWGLDKIHAYKDGNADNGELNIPFLGANIYYNGSNSHPSWIDPYTIINHEGYKVGIIGLIGDDQESDISFDKVANYEFKNSNYLAKKYAKYLRTEEHCDVVVIATHDYDTYLNNTFASYENDYRIDAIFCGHTHQSIEEYVSRYDDYKIPVVQSYTKNGNAGVIELTFDDNEIVSSYVDHYNPGNYNSSNFITDYLLDSYGDIINEGESTVVNIPSYLSKQNIGKLVSSFMLTNYNADLAFINTGGIRTTIQSGKLKLSKVLEVFPFDNRTLLVKMNGKDIKTLIDKQGKYLYYQVGNLEGGSFIDNKEYLIATIDYVYTGEYYVNSFNKTVYKDTNRLLRDDFIDALKASYK